jgi:predicted ArsR family transcriptional regulator
MTEKSLAECHEIAPFGPAKPKGRGRPAKVYSLTPHGRDFFENQYQGLAEDSVDFINQLQGSKGVKLFAEKRASKIFEKYVSEIEKSKSLDKKVEKLTEVLTKEGFAATSDKGSGPTHTIQLCQHNCPIAHVAEKHNEFCDAELEMFNSILGVNVTRLSTIAKGGNVCTSLISTLPKTAVSSAKQYKENK